LPKSAPPALDLENKERQQLQQLVNRHNTPQQLALRASIILLADEGHNHREIARELNISRDMARLWRTRWLILSEKDIAVEERLQDAERSGAPATFSLEQIVQLFAIACENPEVYERPISQWTARELADEMVKQGIVENISPRHVGRLLKEASLKPHQSGYWLNPPPTLCSTRKSKISATPTSAHQKGLRLENEPSVSTK
jgi:putative transposase